jgi:multiple sugar transport system ATP-binding protein
LQSVLPRLILEQLSKRFDGRGAPTAALSKLSLEVGEGELLVLVGPSGCGKSTALRLIAGLEQPTGGRIRLDGLDLAGVPPRERDVAMVFQGYALYPHMTAREIMAFPLKMRGASKQERERRVSEVAEIVGLTDKLDRLPGELSGGERQRVAMGRAIVRKPKLFLFDEPLSNLDAKLRGDLRIELVQLVRRVAATAIYVTHDQVEAMTMADRIAVMKSGELQQIGSPRDIYQRPANRFVAQFLGSPAMNVTSARGEGSPGTVAVPSSLAAVDRLSVGFRPEHLRVGERSDGLTLDAVVSLVEPLGAETIVNLDANGTPLRARIAGFGGPAVGERVRASVAADHLFWFDGEGNRVDA